MTTADDRQKDGFIRIAGYITEDSAERILDDAIVASRQLVSEYLEQLLISAGVTPYELQKITGISRQSIEQALSRSRSVSKPVVFALCLVFRMDQDTALDTVARCGFGLTNAPEDLLFREFLTQGVYRLHDYVDSVRCMYELLGREELLPAFFAREYTNNTL